MIGRWLVRAVAFMFGGHPDDMEGVEIVMGAVLLLIFGAVAVFVLALLFKVAWWVPVAVVVLTVVVARQVREVLR